MKIFIHYPDAPSPKRFNSIPSNITAKELVKVAEKKMDSKVSGSVTLELLVDETCDKWSEIGDPLELKKSDKLRVKVNAEVCIAGLSQIHMSPHGTQARSKQVESGQAMDGCGQYKIK